MATASTLNFYSDLPGFSDFEKLAEDSIYHDVPDDWFVVITDFQGSTKAIEAGRYRDVNTIGAAAIALLQKLFGGEQLAFVFGGDGATFLVPPDKINKTSTLMGQLKAFAKSQFDISLRVGIVPVHEVHQAGQLLQMAKFQIAGNKSTAFLRGGGVSWADNAIKESALLYELTDVHEDVVTELEGLSCRWQPLASRQGSIVSILVQPRSAATTRIFENLLGEIKKILGGDFDEASPVQLESMVYKPFFRSLRDEWKYTRNKFSKAFFDRILMIILCQAAFRFHLPVPFAAQKYMVSIPKHSDYRKYDDMLRLILDCSINQVQRIRQVLEAGRARGEIFYGLFESSHALMTCLVETIADGGHIHLIDGSDGGYAMAARNLKEQKRAAEVSENEESK